MADRNADVAEERRIELRIGINLGDIIVDGDDIHGDGVNIAARLQEMAAPGGTCVSGVVFDSVKDKLDLGFKDLGPRVLKNIAEPVRIYRLHVVPNEEQNTDPTHLPLPSKPSIAVLPFDNMSGDPEQGYFADGIADEIITGLSRFRDLFVIARNSSFTYKGRAVDIKQVGRELGVRYVLEGGVRKAGDRVRVMAQLIEAATGHHLWAEKYDGELTDIFELQDEITASVVGAVQPTVFLAETERIRREPPSNLSAYELCMRGWAHQVQFGESSLLEARAYFLKAIELDDRLPQAYTGLAGTHFFEFVNGWSTSPGQSIAEASLAAEKAVTLDEADAEAHVWQGFVRIFNGRLEAALAELGRAVELSPNNAHARVVLGLAFCFVGRPEDGAEEVRAALRLSPRDWLRFNFLHNLAFCQYTARDYAAAAETAMQVVALKPDYQYGYWHLAGACGQLGQTERAEAALHDCHARARREHPGAAGRY